jgi:beta-1,4-mannosyl-glycoprotein beta-1,4-N-acetylglucosaminyltransferase
MMSDLDEIPRGSLLKELKNHGILEQYGQFVTLVLRGSFYYVNTKFMSPENHVWFPCPVICKQSTFMNIDLKWLRNNKDNFSRVFNAGWHFSHLGKPEILQQKMLASSHTEFSGDHYTSFENIKRRRDNLIDPYDRGYEIKRFDLDNDYPKYLLDNLERFKEFVL